MSPTPGETIVGSLCQNPSSTQSTTNPVTHTCKPTWTSLQGPCVLPYVQCPDCPECSSQVQQCWSMVARQKNHRQFRRGRVFILFLLTWHLQTSVCEPQSFSESPTSSCCLPFFNFPILSLKIKSRQSQFSYTEAHFSQHFQWLNPLTSLYNLLLPFTQATLLPAVVSLQSWISKFLSHHQHQMMNGQVLNKDPWEIPRAVF